MVNRFPDVATAGRQKEKQERKKEEREKRERGKKSKRPTRRQLTTRARDAHRIARRDLAVREKSKGKKKKGRREAKRARGTDRFREKGPATIPARTSGAGQLRSDHRLRWIRTIDSPRCQTLLPVCPIERGGDGETVEQPMASPKRRDRAIGVSSRRVGREGRGGEGKRKGA
jgi:hypothetical protein